MTPEQKLEDLRNKFGRIYTEVQLRMMNGDNDPLLNMIVEFVETHLKTD